MYRPPAFKEDRAEVLTDLIRDHPLGTLVTCSGANLAANLVPFQLSRENDRDVLNAHLAKANNQIAALRSGSPALIIFQGPQAYVSPSFYPTKAIDGRVVPTWNYVVVQARGVPAIIEDESWLRSHLDKLTAQRERGQAIPWSPQDAPSDYLSQRLKGIVGVRILIDEFVGKWKVSQNQPFENWVGTHKAMISNGNIAMADQMRTAGLIKKA